MPIFKIVNDINEIKLPSKWVDSTKFGSKDRIVDQTGRISSHFLGVQVYQLIAKKERIFSCPELWGRRFLGALAICCSIGMAFFISKTIKDLISKKKETIRFGIIYDPANANKIKSLVMGDFCGVSEPCRHDCKVTFIDGKQSQIWLSGIEIQKLFRTAPEKVDLGRFGKGHFAKYNKQAMHS